jgi:hypothetical protein
MRWPGMPPSARQQRQRYGRRAQKGFGRWGVDRERLSPGNSPDPGGVAGRLRVNSLPRKAALQRENLGSPPELEPPVWEGAAPGRAWGWQARWCLSAAPRPQAVAVARGNPLGALLIGVGTASPVRLGGHQCLDDVPQHGVGRIGISNPEPLGNAVLNVHAGRPGARTPRAGMLSLDQLRIVNR